MQFVRKLVYTKEIEDLRTLLSEEIKHPSSKIAKYSNVLKRVKDMQENKEEWAIAHRYDITMRGKHTNNYSEASVRILKDHVFELVTNPCLQSGPDVLVFIKDIRALF